MVPIHDTFAVLDPTKIPQGYIKLKNESPSVKKIEFVVK